MADVHHKAALYDLLLETVPDYAVFLLTPAGIITEWNPAIGRLFGYEEADLVGKHISEIFTEEDRAQGLPEQEIQSAIEKGTAVDLHWHVRKTGPPLFVDALVVPLVENGVVKQILKIVRDINPHHLVGGLQNPLTESIEDPIFLKDHSGRFIFVTESAARLLGATDQNECVYLRAAEGWPGPIARRWAEVDEIVRRQGKSVEFEIPITVNGAEKRYSFRETPWRNDKNEVVGLVAVGRDVTEDRQLENGRNQLLQREKELLSERVQVADTELSHNQEQLKSLAGRLLTAQEEERRRIAREMHDDLAQRLAALNFELEDLHAKGSAGRVVPEQDISKLIDSVASIAEGVREISHRLHPAILEDLGLAPALRKLVEDFARAFRLPVELKLSLPTGRTVPMPVSTTVYRITQEALRNTTKHCRDASATVELTEREGGQELQLRVCDSGPGFDVSNARASGHGLGLASMEERAKTVGGRLTVASSPANGTTVTVVLPMPAE